MPDELTKTATIVPVTTAELYSVWMWILGNNHRPPHVCHLRQTISRTIKAIGMMDHQCFAVIEHDLSVPMSDEEVATVFDWLSGFSELPKNVRTFRNRLAAMLFPQMLDDEDIHEGGPR